jgi:predicted MFS family arabinose efflux permease
MAAVMAAEFMGITLCGVPSGHLATLLGPRKTMLVSDLSRAPVIALIPVLYWSGLLSFPLLLGIAFAIGSFFPAYSSSQQLVMSRLVDDDERRLTRVGGLFSAVNETASFVGPALGGLFVAILGPARVLIVDATSYLIAFGLLATSVPAMPRPDPPEKEDTSVWSGVRYLLRSRPLLGRIIGVGVQNIGGSAMMATLPVMALTTFRGGAPLAGWFLASYGAGSVVGGLISARTRTSSDRTAVLAIGGIAVCTWPLLVPVSTWIVVFAVAGTGICSGLFYPRFFASLTVQTPPALRGKVLTSVSTALSAAGPIGFVGAGLLLEHADSTTPSIVLATAAATIGAVIVAITAIHRSGRFAIDAA